jgi:hypothetical protein
MYYSVGMRKTSLRAVFFAGLCAVGVEYLSGCVNPVNLKVQGKDNISGPDTDVTVTFHSWNYATSTDGTPYTKSVIPGSAIGSTNWPAEPTQPGYMFLGWWDKDGHMHGGADVEDWGTQVTYATIVRTDMDVFARWLELSGDGALIQVYSSLGQVAQASKMNIPRGGGDVFRIKNEDSFSSYEWIYNGDIISILSEIIFFSGGPGIFNTDNTGVRPIVIRAVTNESKWESSYFYVEVQ